METTVVKYVDPERQETRYKVCKRMFYDDNFITVLFDTASSSDLLNYIYTLGVDKIGLTIYMNEKE